MSMPVLHLTGDPAALCLLHLPAKPPAPGADLLGGRNQRLENKGLDSFELLGSASQRDGFWGERGAQAFRRGREERDARRSPLPRPSRGHRTLGAGVLERLFERSPLTSLEFTSSRGCWEPPKLSNSGFSPSLCRCLSAKGFEGAQRVPLFYLRMCSGMLLSSSTQRRRSGSHPESVPVICEPGQGPKQNGQSLPSW